MRNVTFHDRVAAYTEKAAVLFPGEVVFSKKQLAAIAGMSPKTLYNDTKGRYVFPTRKVTIREFVRMEMN